MYIPASHVGKRTLRGLAILIDAINSRNVLFPECGAAL